jgi:hypothetical protein
VNFPEELAVFDRLRTIRDFLSPEALLSSKKDLEAKGKYAKCEDPRYDGATILKDKDVSTCCCKPVLT